ncbi:MAG: DnaB-like helicase C-terminal domain-containing protein [Frankiaceae bacterium]
MPSLSGDDATLGAVLESADGALRSGRAAGARAWRTGFQPLDTYLDGGLRSGQLILLGGGQGTGKTTFVLQVLRNVVAAGGTGLYFSYEHDADVLLERFLALEATEVAGNAATPLRRLRGVLERSDGSGGGLAERMAGLPGAVEAVQAIASYGPRLHLRRSDAAGTSVALIADEVATLIATGEQPVVVVDYLQKVPVPGSALPEIERVTLVVEALKDMALAAGVPVLAVVAADTEGLAAGRRTRIQHLRGAGALAYEADVVLLLNDKFDVVARHHLAYDVHGAQRFHDWAVVSLEKNRSGLDRIDVQFRKQFEHGRFDPEGSLVEEQLVGDRLHAE